MGSVGLNDRMDVETEERGQVNCWICSLIIEWGWWFEEEGMMSSGLDKLRKYIGKIR